MEDILWAKNRHLFGGLEPSNMKTFTATKTKANEADDGTITVTIKAKGPGVTMTPNGQVLCVCEKVIIRKSTEGYPKDEFDGELVATVTDKNYGTTRTITDENVKDGKTYYYAAFPCSYQGVCNRNKANRAMVDLSHVIPYTYFFGYDLDLDDSNPATRVSYPDDVDNAMFEPVKMDYENGVFTYGGWRIEPGTKFMPRPCMLKYDGTVDHYLDPNNYALKTDGTASSVADMSFAGNAMMEWPKIYTKRWDTTDSDGNKIYHFRCSNIKIDDDWDCWCNYDINDNVIDHFYTPIYFGSSDGTRLRSISGASPKVSTLPASLNTMARANGSSDWTLEVFADRLLIQDLLVLMSKSTNTQESYGMGCYFEWEEYEKFTIGDMDTKGMFWGSTDLNTGVKVFGMENWWAGYSRHIAGCSSGLNSSYLHVKITRGTHDGSTATDYSFSNYTGYITTGTRPSFINNSTSHEGYINSMTTYPWGRIPYNEDGSNSTYECDCAASFPKTTTSNYKNIYTLINGFYFSNKSLSTGGEGRFYRYEGAFAFNLEHKTDDLDGRSDCLGAALSCKPSAQA